MLKHYLEEIIALEFSERDSEIQKSITTEKNAMISRGLLNSSMTLQKFAEFFGAEFKLRCDFIKAFIISHNILCQGQDAMTTAKSLFQTKAFEQKDKLLSAYANSTKPITDLLRSNLPIQIEEGLITVIENRIKKNNIYIEIAYQTSSASKIAQTPVVTLKPDFYGVTIDVAELWKRYII